MRNDGVRTLEDKNNEYVFHSLVIDLDNGVFQLNGKDLKCIQEFVLEMKGHDDINVYIKQSLFRPRFVRNTKETD